MFIFIIFLVLGVLSFAISLKIWRSLFSTSSEVGPEVIIIPLVMEIVGLFTRPWLGAGAFILDSAVFFLIAKKMLSLDVVEACQLSGIWALTHWLVVFTGGMMLLKMFGA